MIVRSLASHGCFSMFVGLLKAWSWLFVSRCYIDMPPAKQCRSFCSYAHMDTTVMTRELPSCWRQTWHITDRCCRLSKALFKAPLSTLFPSHHIHFRSSAHILFHALCWPGLAILELIRHGVHHSYFCYSGGRGYNHCRTPREKQKTTQLSEASART